MKRIIRIGVVALALVALGCGSDSSPEPQPESADPEAEIREAAERWAEAYGTGNGETACSPSLVTAEFVEQHEGDGCAESLETLDAFIDGIYAGDPVSPDGVDLDEVSFEALKAYQQREKFDGVPIEEAEIQEISVLGQDDSAAVTLDNGAYSPHSISLELVDGEWLVRSF